MFLKQSTAATIVVGPCVDATDGVTAEVGLTIAQADVRLSKNGAAFAQKSDATSATHMESGYYSVPLNTTDTGTLGLLRVAVSESGALPVWRDFVVLAANVYDSLVSASDNLQVDAVQVTGTAQTARDLGATLGVAGAGLTAVPWNAAWDAEVQSEAADALTAYDPPTRAELTSDVSTLATAASLATVAGYIDTEVAAILAAVDTEIGALQTDVTAIKAKTDSLAFTSGNVHSEMKVAAALSIGDTALSTAALEEIATTFLDLANAVETGLTPRQALRGMAAVLFGKLSGAGTGTEVFRNAIADAANRITATVTADGDRTAITANL